IQVSLRNGNGGGLIDGRADGWQGRDKKLMLGLEGSHCSTPAGGFLKITWLENRLLGGGDRLFGRLPVPHSSRGTPPGWTRPRCLSRVRPVGEPKVYVYAPGRRHRSTCCSIDSSSSPTQPFRTRWAVSRSERSPPTTACASMPGTRRRRHPHGPRHGRRARA